MSAILENCGMTDVVTTSENKELSTGEATADVTEWLISVLADKISTATIAVDFSEESNVSECTVEGSNDEIIAFKVEN
jgi:hypothetical protein